MTDEENKGAMISETLAEYIGVEPETIRGWVIGVERETEEGVSFSAIWSTNVSWWGLLGYVGELKRMLQMNRDASAAASTNGVTDMSRAQRRGRGRSRGRT